jgi:hypothetical protein
MNETLQKETESNLIIALGHAREVDEGISIAKIAEIISDSFTMSELEELLAHLDPI